MVNYAYDYVKQQDYSNIRYTPEFCKCHKFQSKPKDIPIKYGVLFIENVSNEAYFVDTIEIAQLQNVKFLYQFHSENKFNLNIDNSIEKVNKTINTSLQSTKNLNMSNVISRNVSMLNDRSMVSITIQKTHFKNRVMLSPGNYYILIFKADNPNINFEWEVTSKPEEIDKFE